MQALYPKPQPKTQAAGFQKLDPSPELDFPALATLLHQCFCISDVNIVLGNNTFQVNSLSGLHAHTKSDREIKKKEHI